MNADIANISVRPACPCGRKLSKIPIMNCATTVADRKCSSCHARWRIIITPMSQRHDRRIDKIEMTRKADKVHEIN